MLSDHQALRRDLAQIEALAAEVSEPSSGRRRTTGLRDDVKWFLTRLLDHMRWEEAYLLPALREADAWGEERARRLVSDHREQREIFAFLLERLDDSSRPDPMVARDVTGLAALLREDMREEEADLLDERVLRDDVVGIEVETG